MTATASEPAPCAADDFAPEILPIYALRRKAESLRAEAIQARASAGRLLGEASDCEALSLMWDRAADALRKIEDRKE